MSKWHTCDTAHCWAGWIEFLAGDDGRLLAEKTSTLFAAMQINKASSSFRISPGSFFIGNKEALAEIKELADKEKITTFKKLSEPDPKGRGLLFKN